MRRTRALLGWAVLIAVMASWAVLFRPTSLGGPVTYVIVRGDSMLPTYASGDLVVVRAADDYAVGDVVAFRVPAGEIGEGQIVIHRLIERSGAFFTAKGDNNAGPDPWPTDHSRILGRAWLSIPSAGGAASFVAQPVIAGGLAMAAVVALCLARPPDSARPRRRPSPG